MSLFEFVMLLATLLCALTAGFVFAFATVVMPGIGKLGDREFIRAFQVIDGIIQDGHPLFALVWLGSAVATMLAAVLAMSQADGAVPIVVAGSALTYVLAVQLPTLRINVPLNNALQALDIDAMDATALAAARRDFEARWVRWNTIRTGVASLVSAALMVGLLML